MIIIDWSDIDINLDLFDFKANVANFKKKYTPIRRLSKKRESQNREYLRLRGLFLMQHEDCEAKIKGICTGQATQVHHKAGRTSWRLTDVSNFLACCGHCHDHIEHNPNWAKEQGFSKSRLAI